MAIIKITDGRSSFFQWDSNVTLTVEDYGDATQVHFLDEGAERTLTVMIKDDGTCDVPNILLQRIIPIKCYLYTTVDGKKTVQEFIFDVRKRQKPSTYVYTQTEVLNYEALAEEIISIKSDYLKRNEFSEHSDPTDDDKMMILDSNNSGKYFTLLELANKIRTDKYIDKTWSDIEALADSGQFNYEVGTAFTGTMESYDCPWVYVGSRDFVSVDGSTLTNRPIFMPLYATSHSFMYQQYPAFYYAKKKLTAGTYYVHFATKWGQKLADDCLDWEFTVTKDIPVGARLSGFRYGYYSSAWTAGSNGMTLRVYDSNGIDILETVSISQCTDTTNKTLICEIGTKRSGNVNDIYSTFLCGNEWELSGIRQWLNSGEKTGKWWSSKGKFDLAPAELNNVDGFLTLIPEELRAVAKTVKIKTALNTVNYASGSYSETFDKVFLPSLEELFINPQRSGEGNYLQYWKERLNIDSPLGWYSSNINDGLKIGRVNAKTTPSYIWLRSCISSAMYHSWFINTSGCVNGNYCCYSYCALPLIVI